MRIVLSNPAGTVKYTFQFDFCVINVFSEITFDSCVRLGDTGNWEGVAGDYRNGAGNLDESLCIPLNGAMMTRTGN